jgi:GxxExxY protein
MKICSEVLIEDVLGAALTVHKQLGPGLLESIYRSALSVELNSSGIQALSEVPIPVIYKGRSLGIGYRIDLLVADALVLELKCVESLAPIHTSQLITYLRLLNIKRGLIINFNVRLLKNGIKRISI